MAVVDDAKDQLTSTDRTILRCAEKGIALPPDWIVYRDTLREIASGTKPGPLPEKPDYPVGS